MELVGAWVGFLFDALVSSTYWTKATSRGCELVHMTSTINFSNEYEARSTTGQSIISTVVKEWSECLKYEVKP